MDGSKAKLADAGQQGCAMVQRPKTVGEEIDDAITECNHNLVRLMALRADAQAKGLLGLPQPLMAACAHPNHHW